jgi:hypothetical protein
MTTKIKPTDFGKPNTTTGSSTQVGVREFEMVETLNSIPWIGTQKLDRTQGKPRELGEGARRAITVHGEILERLAE